jgi:DNA repair protein RecN (Recombination protein N)
MPESVQIVNQSISALSDLSSLTKELEEPTQLLVEAQIQIQEASHQLRHFLGGQEIDPQGLLELDKQISIIQNLSRKHQVDPEELPDVAKNLTIQLDNLNHSSERIGWLASCIWICASTSSWVGSSSSLVKLLKSLKALML